MNIHKNLHEKQRPRIIPGNKKDKLDQDYANQEK